MTLAPARCPTDNLPVHERERRDVEGAGPVVPVRRALTAQHPLLFLQRTAGNAAVVELLAEERKETARPIRGGREPHEPTTRADMKRSFGMDFGSVRVHQGPEAAVETLPLQRQAEAAEREEEGPPVQELAVQRHPRDRLRHSPAVPSAPLSVVYVQRAAAPGPASEAEAFEALLDEMITKWSAELKTPKALAERAARLAELQVELRKPGFLLRISRWAARRPALAGKLSQALRVLRVVLQTIGIGQTGEVPTQTPPRPPAEVRSARAPRPPVTGAGPEPPSGPKGPEPYKRVTPRAPAGGQGGFATPGAVRGMGMGFIYGWVLENYIDLIRAGLGNVQQRARFGLPLSWKQQQELLESEKSAKDRESLRRHYEAIAKDRGISVEEAEKEELAKQAKTRHLVRKEMTIKAAP